MNSAQIDFLKSLPGWFADGVVESWHSELLREKLVEIRPGNGAMSHAVLTEAGAKAITA